MSYQTVKNYFKQRLEANGFSESKSGLEFDGDVDFDNKFIVESNDIVAKADKRLNDRFYPDRTFTVKIAKRLSETGGVFERDSFQIQIERLLKDIDKPANYTAQNLRLIVFERATTQQASPEYLVATLSYLVEDELVYV